MIRFSASFASSGPDYLLVCGCKGKAFSVTFRRNAPVWSNPKIRPDLLPEIKFVAGKFGGFGNSSYLCSDV
jgi:hypothetical protein